MTNKDDLYKLYAESLSLSPLTQEQKRIALDAAIISSASKFNEIKEIILNAIRNHPA